MLLKTVQILYHKIEMVFIGFTCVFVFLLQDFDDSQPSPEI